MADKKYKTVTVDFETNNTINNPSCPEFIDMKKNPPQGETKYDGIEFKAKQTGYTFTNIAIIADRNEPGSPEWPTATIGTDGGKSTLQQDDLYRDPAGTPTNHTYIISYTGKNNFSSSFDPGIRNQ